MSLSMTKGEGVTVFTLTVDPKSSCPPLCQIIKSLCYSPVWCTVSQQMSTVQRMAQSVLGALHIMTGFLHIGLGVILLSGPNCFGWLMFDNFFPVWMGVLFILFGVMCILSEKFPSQCMVSINVILNMTGVAFAITAIVLYSITILDEDLSWMCSDDNYGSSYDDQIINTSTEESVRLILESCINGKYLILMLLRGIKGVLIVLSVLELCVTISSVVMGIKALKSWDKRENEKTGDLEQHQPLLKKSPSNTKA
ncbi:B-lymphocyte antigen CD20-like [Limanda limanda]|uniref:B-lymphocyte antigen CD20-like n=1 Tax=Limanda limanda TaxID=27771 RepID=UPI0029C7E670|nr:B-lymphocyte antigen CD20-like [Limanda limanda]